MFSFDFNPLEVGNVPTIGMMEEDQEEKVMRCVTFIADNYGMRVPTKVIDDAIDAFGIDFLELPRWLQHEFDRFDCID